MTHPLTDEMMEAIHGNRPGYSNPFDEDDMCAAADWQLEKDAEYFAQYLVKNFGLAPEVAELRAEWFKEAMRPQEDN